MSKRATLRFVVLVGILACSLVFAQPVKASIVTNGGFESGDFSGWSHTGPTTYDGVIDYATLGMTPASSTYLAYFGAIGSVTTLSQDLATNPSATYELSFLLSNLGGPGSMVNSFAVRWDGNPTALAFDNANAFGFTANVFSGLVPTGTSTTLTFEFRNDASYWLVDDIKVTAVPDAGSSLLLFGMGVAGLTAVRRRMR
jgi:hypothetical protein